MSAALLVRRKLLVAVAVAALGVAAMFSVASAFIDVDSNTFWTYWGNHTFGDGFDWQTSQYRGYAETTGFATQSGTYDVIQILNANEHYSCNNGATWNYRGSTGTVTANNSNFVSGTTGYFSYPACDSFPKYKTSGLHAWQDIGLSTFTFHVRQG